MSIITSQYFGKTHDGKAVNKYTFTDEMRQSVSIINYGCIITEILVKDKKGKLIDVALGHETFEEYEKNHSFFGAIVGRCANRIENGRFKLNNIKYQLTQNDGVNHLHGGIEGFNSKYWNGEIVKNTLLLKYSSKHMEEGYPGNLDVWLSVTFENGELALKYSYISDEDTIVNLTNHSFFNLNGQGRGDILEHELCINADRFSESNENLIPSGTLLPVENTPFDFKHYHRISEQIKIPHIQIKQSDGYDINYALNSCNKLFIAAELRSQITGIKMTIITDRPAMQFYIGQALGFHGYTNGKGGRKYNKYGGMCLETQAYPNDINMSEHPGVVLKKGNKVMTDTIYKFSGY